MLTLLLNTVLGVNAYRRIRMGKLYSKLSFWEVRRFCVWKLDFITLPTHCHKTMFWSVKPMVYLPNDNFEYGYYLDFTLSITLH